MKSIKFLGQSLTLILCIILFYFFYVRYVPLIREFQLILILLLLFLFTITFIKPKIGIFIFLFLIPTINTLPYFFRVRGINPLIISFIVIFLAYLFRTFAKKDKFEFFQSHYFYLNVFIILLIISFLISFLRYSDFFPFKRSSIHEWVINYLGLRAGGAIQSVLFGFLILISGYLFFMILMKEKNKISFFYRGIYFLILGFFLSEIISLVQYSYKAEFGNPFGLGNIGLFTDRNSFGIFLVFILPLIIGNILDSKLIKKIIFFVILILALYIFPTLNSRAGTGGFLLALILFIFLVILKTYRLRKRRMQIALSLVFIFLLIFSVAYFYYPHRPVYDTVTIYDSINHFYKKLSGLESSIQWKDLFRYRYTHWKSALIMIKNYPLTGVGIGAYVAELPNFYKEYSVVPLESQEFYQKGGKLPWGARVDTAQNLFLHILAEMGLIGFIPFIAFIAIIAKKMYRRLKRAFKRPRRPMSYRMIGVYSAFISFLIISMFGFHINFPEICFTFFFFLAMIITEARNSGIGKNDLESADNKLLNSQDAPSELKKKSNRAIKLKVIKWLKGKKMIIAVIILIYFGVSLYHSVASFSLPSRTEKFGWKQDYGFYKWEEGPKGEYRWSKKGAGYTQSIEKPFIIIPIIASHPDLEKKSLDVRVFFSENPFKKGKLIDEFKIRANKWLMRGYYFPQYVGKDIFFSFKLSRTWNPNKDLGVPDPRNLGIGIAKVQFKDKIGEEGIQFIKAKNASL